MDLVTTAYKLFITNASSKTHAVLQFMLHSDLSAPPLLTEGHKKTP